MQPTLLSALKAVRAGDVAAFAPLVEAYWPALAAYVGASGVARADVDDLVELAFVKAWRKLDKLKQLESFRSWLFTIASNLLRDHRRRVSREKKTMLEYAHLAPKSADPPRPPDERLGLLSQLVPQLKDVERQILALRFDEGRNCREIADILGKKHATVRSILHRALKGLRKNLEGTALGRGGAR